MTAIQVRIGTGRTTSRVDGPDDAEVVVTVAPKAADQDPSVAFMTGTLKTTGPTGPCLDALADGRIAAAIQRALVAGD
jgi:hypothetical protein